jgi:hypothetical protein
VPDLTDTYANEDGQFVFQTDETTPQQVVNALEDFTTFLDRFEAKSREYGEGSFFFLGTKGQFSDIYRKIIKLKTALWDGKPEQLTSEGVEEVIHDLIGHLFMTLQCMRHEGFEQYKPCPGVEDYAAYPQCVDLPDELQKMASPRLQDILVQSSAFGRLITDSYPVDPDREREEKAKAAKEHERNLMEKREKVLRLYPQIGRGSLEARTEESLDWLIEAAENEVPEPERPVIRRSAVSNRYVTKGRGEPTLASDVERNHDL